MLVPFSLYNVPFVTVLFSLHVYLHLLVSSTLFGMYAKMD